MQIKMNASAAGPDGSFQEGHVYDVPNQISQEQADSFIRGGYAVLVFVPAKNNVVAKTASVAPAETAAAIPQRNKRRHK
jgi:hypothetical protein